MIRPLRALLPMLLLVAAPGAARPDGETAATTGRSIASLASLPLTDRAGRAVTLGSRIAPGKPTLISVWASWCPPCIVEAPYLARMRRAFGARYNFVYVNRRDGDPDPAQPPAAIARFLDRAGLSDEPYVVADVPAYERLLGADLKSLPAGKVGIPRVYVFDRAGRQIHTAYGFAPDEAPALERLLRQAAR